MTDKARKRRKAFAAVNNVSCRTAANMMAVNARRDGGAPPSPTEVEVPASPPPPTKGEMTTLTLTCPGCKTRSEVPLRVYASGTAHCAHPDKPHTLAIPNNGRYRRLIREIDVADHQPGEIVGLISVRTEPFQVRYRPEESRVVVYFVDTFETREFGRGHWNGKGNGLYCQKPFNGEVQVAVLLWLENVAAAKGANYWSGPSSTPSTSPTCLDGHPHPVDAPAQVVRFDHMSQPRPRPQIKPLSDPEWKGEWISVLAMGERYEYTISWSGRTHELRVMKNDEKPRRLVAKGAWYSSESPKNNVPDTLPEMRAKILERMPTVWDFYLRRCACN